MRRIRIVTAYDGTAYCGFQVQKNGDTIAAQLNRHLSEMMKEEIRVIGASRTDAGVHALGNVAVFDTSSRMRADRISYAMNTRLPADIRIMHSDEVSGDFHPRFQRTIKTYRYRICNGTFPDPCTRLYTLHYHWALDEGRMQKAADYLTGTHDFTSFCTHKPEVTNHVRTIYRLDVARTGDEVWITVTGSGFLYNMVRIIAGTLLQVGSGMLSPEAIPEILEKRDRAAASDTARPQGLCLLSIEYPDYDQPKPR